MFSLQIVFVLLALHLVQARPQPDGSGDGEQFKTPAQVSCTERQEIRTTILNLISNPSTTVKTFLDSILAVLRKYPETSQKAADLEAFHNKMKKLLEIVKSCLLDSVKDNPTETGEANAVCAKLESDDLPFTDKCNAQFDLMKLMHSVSDKKSLLECIRSNIQTSGLADGSNNHNMMMFKGGPGMIPSSPNSAPYGQPFPGVAFGGAGPTAVGGPLGSTGGMSMSGPSSAAGAGAGMTMSGSPVAAPGAGAPATNDNNVLLSGANHCNMLPKIMQEHLGHFVQQCPSTTDGNSAASAPAVGVPAS